MITRGDKIWIAENLIRGADPVEMGVVLVNTGKSPEAVTHAITSATLDLYMIGALKGRDIFQRRLGKANWTLNLLASLRNTSVNAGKVEKLGLLTLDTDTFFEKYYFTNTPLLIDDVCTSWPAYKKWTPKYLSKTVGDVEVEIQSGRTSDPLYEEQRVNFIKNVKFSDFIDSIKNADTNDVYLTANNTEVNRKALDPIWGDIGELPSFLKEGSDGFMFLGPKGTITPNHHDLTNNLLIQVRGSKKIYLCDSLQQPNMYNHNHVFSRVDLSAIDYDKYPLMKNVTVKEVILNAGQALFIPCGWWHQVKALDFSVSMTYTSFKANNTYPGQEQFNSGDM